MIEEYKKITKLILRQMEDLEYLLPKDYNELFQKIASDNGIILEQYVVDKIISKKIIEQTCTLEKNIEKSIIAIEQQDLNTLQTILAEVKKFKFEIQTLKELIYLDTLTQVNNRKWMYDTYLDDTDIQFTHDGYFCLIDINDFKRINDVYGHSSGDKILKYLANEFKKSKGDVIRFGGDEFIIMFDKKTNINNINKIFSNIRENIMLKKVKFKNNVSFNISFSFGCIEFKNGDEFNNILFSADEIMYQDKAEIKKVLNTNPTFNRKEA